jgi:hypothetical protein
MKRLLTTLTVAASLMASGVSAFDMNMTITETSRMAGKPIIGDLTVGVQALISVHGIGQCLIDGKAHLVSFGQIEKDPSEYLDYYKIQQEPDGEFTMTYGPAADGDKDLPSMIMSQCSAFSRADPTATFFPIKSINGFTDVRSFLVDLLNKGFK